MFKKRIKVAGIVFATLIALTFLGIVWRKVSDKISRGTSEISVLTGNSEEADGVRIRVRTLERIVRTGESRRSGWRYILEDIYQTKTVEVEKNQEKTGMHYEKKDVSELKNRMYFSGLSVELPQKQTEGTHKVKGSDISYDLIWYLTDGFSYSGETEYRIRDYVTFEEEDLFFYFYDGDGPEQYEGFSLPLSSVNHYTGRYLCELDGALYGYMGTEPEYEFRCTYSYSGDALSETGEDASSASGSVTQGVWNFEETCENVGDREVVTALSEFGMPEIHMTVKKGIYRFDEDGTAAWICPMGELTENFRFLWMIAEAEKNTLTIVGTKEDVLLTYVYSFDTGEVETTVLWSGGEELEEWYKVAETCISADTVTDGERTYLCYTDSNLSKVNLAVFENGNRVFEGEVLQKSYGEEGLQNFSLDSNEENWVESVVDKVEISLKK